MVVLPVDKVKKLYYKNGYSAREIGEFLGVSTEVVYDFMQKYNLPRRNLYEQNRILFAKKPLSFKVKKNLTQKEQKLKIAAIMLYWAEGAKRSQAVDFTNSEPRMVKFFLKFLREICRVDEQRLRILLYCYANQDIGKIKKFWSKLTKIPLSQFIKPYIRQDYSLKCKREMKYGLIHIRYSDKKLWRLILEWIDRYLERNL